MHKPLNLYFKEKRCWIRASKGSPFTKRFKDLSSVRFHLLRSFIFCLFQEITLISIMFQRYQVKLAILIILLWAKPLIGYYCPNF